MKELKHPWTSGKNANPPYNEAKFKPFGLAFK